MVSQTEAWILYVGLSALTGLSLEFVWRGIAKLKDIGKQWTVALDEGTKSAKLKKLHIEPEWVIDTKAGKAYSPEAGGVYDASVSARMGYSSGWGKLYLFDSLRGFAYRAPTDEELDIMHRNMPSVRRGQPMPLVPVDANAIYRKLQRNIKQDMVDKRAPEKKNSMVVAMAAIGGIMLIGILGVLIYIVNNMGGQ